MSVIMDGDVLPLSVLSSQPHYYLFRMLSCQFYLLIKRSLLYEISCHTSRVINVPPEDNANYEKLVNDTISNAVIFQQQLKQEEALKRKREYTT